jgi:ribosomal protein S18 acetylase RimI-like enzyme
MHTRDDRGLPRFQPQESRVIETLRCTIKRVDASQADCLLGVYRACEDFLALGPQSQASVEMVRADLEHSRIEGGVCCGVWNRQGELIGVVDYIASGFEGVAEQGFMSLLMLVPSHRAAGIGTEVVTAIERRLAENGIATVLSAVQTNNTPAIRFWQKMGYRIESGPEPQEDGTVTYRLKKQL